MSSGICGQRRPRSAWASAQSDQGLHCLLTESLDATECINGEQQPGYFGHAQDDLNLQYAQNMQIQIILCMPPFSLDETPLFFEGLFTCMVHSTGNLSNRSLAGAHSDLCWR